MKVKKHNIIAILVVFTLLVVTFGSTSSVYAEITPAEAVSHNETQSVQIWGIGEYDSGGSAIIPCAATCHVIINENYVRPYSGYVDINSSSLFAYAENWQGEAGGYDLYVTADYQVSFNNGETHSLSSNYDTIVEPGWIWAFNKSTSGTGYNNNYSLTASGNGGFYAPDGVIYLPLYWKPNARSISVSTTF